jgi:hypothetical protein
MEHVADAISEWGGKDEETSSVIVRNLDISEPVCKIIVLLRQKLSSSFIFSIRPNSPKRFNTPTRLLLTQTESKS